MEIRRFQHRDTARVWALSNIPNIGATADPATPLDLPLAQEPPTAFPLLADIGGSFPAATGEFLVIEHDGHIVGMGGIRRNSPDEAEVLHIRVHPAMRRRGVGTALMTALESRAQELGYARLHLDTATNQPEAIAFYRALGYAEAGTETHPAWSWTLQYFTKDLSGSYGSSPTRGRAGSDPAVWNTPTMDTPRHASDWTRLRDAWLEHISSTLNDDLRVVGWGLVGSFGRGEADQWSDLDLLVVTTDGDFRTYVERDENEHWATASLFIDARRNAPVGAASASTVHITSGLPIWTDWYVYPRAVAAWPADCQVQRGADGFPRSGLSFSEWHGRGPRQAPIEASAEDLRHARLAMVPIAGKYIARHSASAAPMLEFLGAAAAGVGPVQQIAALRDLVADLAPDCQSGLTSAVDNYLSLVARTIE